MIRHILLSIFLFFVIFSSFSQKKQSNEQYIAKYYKIAIREMNMHRIPASITLAQGILESASGNSTLAKKAKNHFGIKCHAAWKGKKYYMDDDTKDECFRVYKTPEQSFIDHSAFLTKRGRYEFLFSYTTNDYKKWAKGLKKAGYATNPKYPQLLISLIERYHLYKYDRNNFVPEEKVIEDVLVLEELDDKDFVLENTDEYIKALMGRNVYYSDKEKGVFIFNRIKTVKAKDRTPLEIAVEFDVDYERFMRYNDIDSRASFTKTQNVFLQPKRFNGSQKNYIVKPGDSMWEISQMFGIKLSHLYKKNLMKRGIQAKPGETLNLRRKRKTIPKTIDYKEVLKTKRTIINDKPKKIVQKTFIKPIEVNVNVNIQSPSQETRALRVRQASMREELENKKTSKIDIENPSITIEEAINEIPVEKKTKVSKNTFIHKVKQGETLYFISKKYNNSIEELKQLNNLLDNGINIGQDLIILQKQ